MKTDEIRQRFLDFFKRQDHRVVRSDSLVPQSDPTLLFTGAGMNQFKEYFLGLKKDLKRAASSQKCLRTGDLDEVGRTAYHHSFFEMLGNFSFGDYFKRDAIRWAWEFLIKEMGLPKERLRVSVHESDEEAHKIWRDEIGVKENWISRWGDKTNFWPSDAPKEGPNGPCGPCSEIYYDQGEGYSGKPHACSIEHDCGRFAELWNLVFTQFDRQEGGRLVPLKNKNIDTGMGLERLACVVQKKSTNFEIDLFRPINEAVKQSLEVGERGLAPIHIYAISDHVRAIVFAITDGVIPSNEGRGYVIRKLIRRALWRAYQLKKVTEPFLYKVVSAVIQVMEGPYPDLAEAEGNVKSTLRGEEERFLSTLETGLNILNDRLSRIQKEGKREVAGDIVFELYDTYGFPDELTKTIAESMGLRIDQKGFDRLIGEQRKRAKEASQISGSIFVSTDLERKLAELAPTQFLGYQTLSTKAKVIFVEVREGRGIVVLDQTPFYAESGGQVGDQGILEGKSFRGRVVDTGKRSNSFVHSVEIEKGSLKVGKEVTATVDKGRRDRAMRNHTATHLLHAVLREVLGKQVRQLGSLVHPDRLRFDYSFSRALSEEELKKIETRVNEEILRDTAVQKEEKRFEEAKKEGALAFFGEKYGDRVRVVTVPGISQEFCGGTHCERTGQIGAFVITSDASIASGVRRIEALTGEGTLNYVQTLRAQVQEASEKLRATPMELVDRIGKLQERVKQLEKSSETRGKNRFDPKELLEKSKKVGDYRIVMQKFDGIERAELRHISDRLKSQAKRTVWVLFCRGEEKVHFLVGLSADLRNEPQDARDLAKKISTLLNGSGGGRKDLAEGGGTRLEALESDWGALEETAAGYVREALKRN